MAEHEKADKLSKYGPRASIDVVIPVYNGQRFILQALQSVSCQTYPAVRIIVVDDGSTDRTPELVKSFKSRVPVDYVRKTNGGLSSARNAGLARCTSEFVAFLDADDEWYPDKLAEQVRVFKNSDSRNLGVVFCKFCIIDENGKETARYPVFDFDASVRGNVFNKLLTGNKIAGSGSAVLARKKCFDSAGGFDESLSACEDWDMWLRLAEKYEFDFVPENLVKIRRHRENMQRDAARLFRNRLLFYGKWIERVPRNSPYRDSWRENIAFNFISLFPRTFSLIRYSREILPKTVKRELFNNARGSIYLFLLRMLPRTVIHAGKARIFSAIKRVR